jgi:hypothetical protein
MNQNEAKEVLAIFRPGTADETDPFFADALELMKNDAALSEWFQRHSAVDTALRAKLREAPVPAGLKEEILSAKLQSARVVWLPRPAAWAVAAAIVGLIILTNWWVTNRAPNHAGSNQTTVESSAEEKIDLATYREKMARIVSANYKMSFRSHDLEEIREFLARNNGHTDYELMLPLQKLSGEGSAVLTWRGINTSLICLDSGRKTMLYLFITDQANLPDAPINTAPQFVQLGNLASASWTQGNKTYLLLAEGDRTLLETYF